MQCAFHGCKETVSGSKQFNSIVERIYLCTKHLILVAELDSFSVDDAEIYSNVKEKHR